MSELDAQISRIFYDGWGGQLTWLALVLTTIGGGWAMLLLLPMYAVEKWRALAVTLTATVVASAGAVFVLKHIVKRVRPCNLLDGVHALCATPTDASFPSGHSCGSFTLVAFAVVVLNGSESHGLSRVQRVLISSALILLAVSVAWSRVYLGVHFPGDVTAGATLGTVAGGLGGWVYLNKVRGRYEAPVADAVADP
jgi:undecaprenyl-diphosphatase